MCSFNLLTSFWVSVYWGNWTERARWACMTWFWGFKLKQFLQLAKHDVALYRVTLCIILFRVAKSPKFESRQLPFFFIFRRWRCAHQWTRSYKRQRSTSRGKERSLLLFRIVVRRMNKALSWFIGSFVKHLLYVAFCIVLIETAFFDQFLTPSFRNDTLASDHHLQCMFWVRIALDFDFDFRLPSALPHLLSNATKFMNSRSSWIDVFFRQNKVPLSLSKHSRPKGNASKRSPFSSRSYKLSSSSVRSSVGRSAPWPRRNDKVRFYSPMEGKLKNGCVTK